MINLLPEQKKKQIADRYHAELLVVWATLATFVFVAGCALVASMYVERYYASVTRATGLVRLADAVQALEKDQAVADVISRTRDRIQRIGMEDKSQGIYELIVDISGRRVSGATIATMSVDKKGSTTVIQLGGTATSRASLLSFVAALEKSPKISSVVSPISNLVKENDIQYAMTINGK